MVATQVIRRLTTVDTSKSYDFTEGEQNSHPQLWEVSLTINCIDNRNGKSGSRSGRMVTVVVERQTLIDAGLLPETTNDDARPEESTAERPATAEDLLLKLLEHLGVFPQS